MPDVVVASVPGLEGGAQAAERILSGPRLPTVVLAEYDELAFGALRTFARAGIEVPGRISAQPVRQQGEAAAGPLVGRSGPLVDGPLSGGEGGSTLIDPRAVLWETVSWFIDQGWAGRYRG